MKKLLVLGLILLSQLVQAQPVLNWYAYSQVTTPGNIRARVPGEEGQPAVETPRFFTTYYIYVTHQPSVTINLENIWIGGKLHKGHFSSVESTPVVNYNYTTGSKPDTTILVGRTKMHVLQLVVEEESSQPGFKLTAQVSKMINKSALTVSYRYKGKLYYKYISQLKALTPVAGI